MRIEYGKTFATGKVVEIESILTPFDDRDKTTQDFIKNYHRRKYLRVDIPTTIALCILDKNESWTDVARKIKCDGWSGASLSEWELYVHDKKNVVFGAVTIPGVRYADDNLIAWVPVVKHRSRAFFKSATEVSMKRSASLTIAKSRIVLIKKIESQKS